MAYSYDGYLRFNTEVDQTGFNHGISGMQSAAAIGAKAIAAGITVATGAVTALSAYAIGAGSNFEAAMSKVAATSGATAEGMELLTAKAKDMGATTKFSATESAEALNYMAMAGWKTQQSIEGLPGIMNLAAASGENLGSVSDIVTDAITAFGLKASDSAHFADVLAAAASSANTDVSMMGSTFKYAAPLAGALGYSIEDTAVATGLMANAGIKAETAGTTLRTMFSNMTGDVQLTGQELGNYTLKMQEVDGTMVPLSQTMGSLREAFSKMTEAEKLSNAESLVGKEAMSGLLAIVNASEADYNKLTAAIGNADGAAEDMAKTVNDNLKGDLTILGSTAESVGIKVYEKFQVPMRKAAQAATDGLGDVLDSLGNGKLDQSIDKIADSTGDLLAKTAELTAAGLPKLINGFAFVVDHGEEAKNTILSIAAAYGVMLAAATVQKWQAMTAAAEAYRVAMVASMGITTTSATATALLTTMMSTQELVVGALTGKVGLHTAATILAERAQLAFNASLLGFPGTWAVIGVAALAAGLVYYTRKQNEATEAANALIESTNSEVTAWEESRAAKMEDIKAQTSQLETTKEMIDELGRLTDANGKVGDNKERVAYLSEKINEILPDTVKFIDDETIAIEGNIESLKRQIELKQANILLDELEAEAAEEREERAASLERQMQLNEDIASQEGEIEQLRIDLSKAGSNARIAILQQEIDEKQNQLDKTKTAFDTEKKYYEEMNQTKDDASKLEIAILQENYEEVDRIMVQRELQLKTAGDSTTEELNQQIFDMKAKYDYLMQTYGNSTSEAIQSQISELNRLIGEYQAELSKRVPVVANQMYQNAQRIGFSYANGLVSPEVIKQVQTSATLLGRAANTSFTGAFNNQTTAQTDAIANRIASAKSSLAKKAADEAAKARVSSLSSISSGVASAASSAANSISKSGITIGVLYGENIISGITQSTGKMKAAITTLSVDSIKNAKEKATSYKEIGTLYIDSMEDGIDSQVDSLIEQVEKLVDAQVEAFGEENEDAKDEYKKAATELMDVYKEALEAGADEAKKVVAEKIQGITEEAQNQYDEIIKQRDRMQDKLSDFGELYTRDEGGKVQLENINEQTEALKRYQTALEGLQDKGISDGLLNEILDLGVEDGTDLAEKLLKNDGVFQRYNEAWTLKQEAAKAIAEQFYADELETLDEDFSQKLDAALASIPEECTNVGVNAIEGVIKGMNDQKADAVAAAKDIADAIIKELKRATETASPSKRAAREVGKPITQGVIKGMKDAYDPQELQAYTDRMMLDIGNSQTKAAQNVSYLNTSSVSNSTVYNEAPMQNYFNLINGTKENIKQAMVEYEFYRRQKSWAKGGA